MVDSLTTWRANRSTCNTVFLIYSENNERRAKKRLSFSRNEQILNDISNGIRKRQLQSRQRFVYSTFVSIISQVATGYSFPYFLDELQAGTNASDV